MAGIIAGAIGGLAFAAGVPLVVVNAITFGTLAVAQAGLAVSLTVLRPRLVGPPDHGNPA